MSSLKNYLEEKLLKPFTASEKLLERVFFHNRILWILIFALVTLTLGYQANRLKLDASFENMIPSLHPYINNYLNHKQDLVGLGNAIRVTVENTEGDIYNAEFQKVLKDVNDEVFFIKGVNRAGLKSIWTANTRWTEVTEDGFTGGAVVPDKYDGSDRALLEMRVNVLKSGQVGTLVSNDFRSAVIYAPLYEIDPQTKEPLSYQRLSEDLEALVREKYETDTVKIHITGFAKIVGDLIFGAKQVVLFFAAAIAITAILLFLYSRCWKSTIITLTCSLIAVIWQLGILKSLGYNLDPYSMLVPFLIFAIAVSHGVQIVNSVMLEAASGSERIEAARRAFRALYIPGLTALVSDGIGFITLNVIDIQVIKDLAVAASVGVAVIILTNLVLLPILLSFINVHTNPDCKVSKKDQIWKQLSSVVGRTNASIILVVTFVMVGAGFYLSSGLKIGDMDAGAPELRPDSRYNLDNKYLTEHYSSSTDIFVVMVKTPANSCVNYDVFSTIDLFQWQMLQLPGVQSSRSVIDTAKNTIAGMNEGNLKWMAINRSELMLNAATNMAETGQINIDCSLIPVLLYLNDHKAETLSTVVEEVQKFADLNNTEAMQFMMAAGNAGIEAATNEVIEKAQYEMLLWVYSVVAFLCLLTFRSLRTVVCIIFPLAVTSLLCQALMAQMGIGVKVATLPVIALGVGIGVDYGIYIFSKLQMFLSQGLALRDAYFETLKTTGRAVAFTGLTLGIGVGTWVLSPIKFQADMGILLTFMFIWNMLGALILLPALVSFLHKPSKGALSGKKNGSMKEATSYAK